MARGTHSPIVDRSQEHSYLVANEDVRGVGQPYMLQANFREASNPLDPTRVGGSTTALTMASIPSPIIGKYIQLPDGTVSTPGLSWASETNSGRYRIGSNNFGESVAGDLKFDWNASRLRLDTGFDLQIGNLTQNRIVFVGATNTLDDDAGLTFDALSGRLACTGYLELGTATDATQAGDFAAGLTGASRLFWDQPNQTLNAYDSSGNRDLVLNMAGTSYYNGTGNFGIGTTGPDRKLDVLSTASNFQMRLTYTDGSIYTDIGTDSGGILNIEPTGATINMIVFPPSAGGNVTFNLGSYDDAGGHTQLNIIASDDLAGDPFIRFSSGTSPTRWSVGVDNSDSDCFLVSQSTGLGTNNYLKIVTTGQISNTISTATTTPNLDLIQSSTGDSATRWAIGSTASFIAGIDNSDSDSWKLSYAASGSAELGTSDYMTVLVGGNVGIGTTGPDAKLDVLSTSTQLRLTHTDGSVYFDFTTDSSGVMTVAGSGNVFKHSKSSTTNVQLVAENTDTSSGGALYRAIVDSGSTGDPYALFTVQGGSSWYAGIDNSDSDKFKIGVGTSVGASDVVYITTGGLFGVGTTPSEIIHGLRASSNTLIRSERSDANAAGLAGFAMKTGASGNVWQWFARNGSMFFGISGVADYGVILSGGNFGIGTTGPDRKLDILDASNPQLRLTHTDGSVYRDWQVDSSGNIKITSSTSGDYTWELEVSRTITGAVTDGYAGGILLDPAYSAATALTVTRHNYIDVQNVSLAGVGPAALTDACVFRFDAAAGTHKAVDSGTTKTTPGTVDAWVKVNVNGTVYYMPAYTSKTT